MVWFPWESLNPQYTCHSVIWENALKCTLKVNKKKVLLLCLSWGKLCLTSKLRSSFQVVSCFVQASTNDRTWPVFGLVGMNGPVVARHSAVVQQGLFKQLNDSGEPATDIQLRLLWLSKISQTREVAWCRRKKKSDKEFKCLQREVSRLYFSMHTTVHVAAFFLHTIVLSASLVEFSFLTVMLCFCWLVTLFDIKTYASTGPGRCVSGSALSALWKSLCKPEGKLCTSMTQHAGMHQRMWLSPSPQSSLLPSSLCGQVHMNPVIIKVIFSRGPNPCLWAWACVTRPWLSTLQDADSCRQPCRKSLFFSSLL